MREQYLPTEYHTLYKIIEGHCSAHHKMPSFEELKFEIRDASTKDKIYAIESLDTDIEPFMLLQYLKNEYTQAQILVELEDYVDNSVAFENAEESIAHLHQIVLNVEEKVDLEEAQESMQRITLFETDEELGKYLTLGINKNFDLVHQFSPRDLILVGGFRGAGKSITCANIAVNMYTKGRSSITYSTEMDKRSVLQRMCAIATGVSATRLQSKNLNITEWEQVAYWWSNRFSDSSEVFAQYQDHRDFDKFHNKIVSSCELLPECQLDVVYDPNLTIGKIHADLDKKLKGGMDIGIIIVDYLNKVKLHSTPSKRGMFDWIEQIEVSSALKGVATTFEKPVFSPFQIDASGEARFSKGILIDADATYILDSHSEEDACISFKCTKMRNGPMRDFTSEMDWNSLKMGPESALTPDERKDEEDSTKTGENVYDV